MRISEALFKLSELESIPKQTVIKVGEMRIPIKDLLKNDLDVKFVDDSSGELTDQIDIPGSDIVDGKFIRGKLLACLDDLTGGCNVTSDGVEAVRKSLPEIISIIRSAKHAERIDQYGHIEIAERSEK